jgi:integrase
MKKPMAKIDLPYVQRFKDRHGHMRHYYRRPGFARLPLPGTPGSVEFMAAYAEADARAPRIDHAAKRVQPRSINALLIEYYKSDDFLTLEDRTRYTYRNMLDRFRAKYGDRSVVGVEPMHLNAIFHGMADTPGAVRNLRKRLSRVFALAVELGWRHDNPVRETKRVKQKTKGFIPWSEADIAAYEARWVVGTKERLALDLLIYTGVRRSDVIDLGAQHVKGGHISVVQEKTDVRIKIPLHPALKAAIEAQPKGMTFLVTEYGRPFTHAGFGGWFKKKTEAAGLSGRTAHGLRKAAGRRLAEAGATAKEIAAVLGHQTLDEVETYTRDADQGRLAEAAMKKLVRTKRERGV